MAQKAGPAKPVAAEPEPEDEPEDEFAEPSDARRGSHRPSAVVWERRLG